MLKAGEREVDVSGDEPQDEDIEPRGLRRPDDDSEGCPVCGNKRLSSWEAWTQLLAACDSCGWQEEAYG